jgi:hypothetical protein
MAAVKGNLHRSVCECCSEKKGKYNQKEKERNTERKHNNLGKQKIHGIQIRTP